MDFGFSVVCFTKVAWLSCLTKVHKLSLEIETFPRFFFLKPDILFALVVKSKEGFVWDKLHILLWMYAGLKKGNKHPRKYKSKVWSGRSRMTLTGHVRVSLLNGFRNFAKYVFSGTLRLKTQSWHYRLKSYWRYRCVWCSRSDRLEKFVQAFKVLLEYLDQNKRWVTLRDIISR